LEKRLQRTPCDQIHLRALDEAHKERVDALVLDVPCSGTGTLRRHPELKARLSPQWVQEQCNLQREILERSAPLLIPGGHLFYITCSLLKAENEDQMDHFLSQHPEFSRAGADRVWTPLQDSTDGFFMAHLRKSV
jgi:16S rRNA (cytosine967-C5)-methyltransferase